MRRPRIRSAAPFSRGAALFAAALLGLGPLGLLQAVAWTGMAFDYSARYGLAEGLGRTFDGQHPCPMCKEITQARQKEKDSKAAVTLTPVKLICIAAPSATRASKAPLREDRTYFVVRESFSTRADRPPSPPPRISAA